MKKEKDETLADESAESPSEQDKECAEGTEVDIPEDFQKEVHSMVTKHGHSKHRLSHISRKVSEARQKLVEKEKGKKGIPDEFSTEDSPV